MASIELKKKEYIEKIDRARAELSNPKYMDTKWLRESSDLWRYYLLEYSQIAPKKGCSVFDVGAGPGHTMWFLRELSGCKVKGFDYRFRPDYAVIWKELDLSSDMILGSVVRNRPVDYPSSYDMILAIGICFDRLERNKNKLWNIREYLFFINDACEHLNPGGELFLRFNVPPKRALKNIFRELRATETDVRFRIRKEEFLASRYAGLNPHVPREFWRRFFHCHHE